MILCAGEALEFEPEVWDEPPPSYEWFFNGLPLSGQTNRRLLIPAATVADSGRYSLVAMNGLGAATSRVAQVTVRLCPALPIALDTDHLPWIDWSTGGDALWSGQDDQSRDGVDAARSGTIAHGQESWLETVVDGPGEGSFWWRTSSERNLDRIEFLLDGDIQFSLSGQVSWETRRFSLTTGSHRLRWRFRRNGSGDGGENAAWVDQVRYDRWSTAPVITSHPESQVTTAGAPVEFRVEAEGYPEPTYHWQHNGRAVGGTGPVLGISNVTEHDLGSYLVVVSNAVGSATSETAILVFGGSVTGLVHDATTGRAIAGATVRAGGKSAVTTDEGRHVLFGVAAGAYTVDLSADETRVKVHQPVRFTSEAQETATELTAEAAGFIFWRKPLDLPEGSTIQEPIAMSPELSDGMRFVLSWDQNPPDLDAHLLTPPIGGVRREVFHLREYRGSAVAPPYATLDWDVRTGSGPETITIHRFEAGVYRYLVKQIGGAPALPGSGAQVRIYRPGQEPQIVTLRDAGSGLFWHAFDVDGITREVTVVDRVSPDDPGWPAITGPSLAESGPTRRSAAQLQGPDNLAYGWEFGDGATATDSHPIHAYSQPGTYTVTLKVTNASGRVATRVRTNYIHVLNNPPSVLAPPGVEVAEDDLPHDVGFSVKDLETPPERLEVRVTSSPERLIPPTTVSLAGTGESRSLRFGLAPDAFGSGEIALEVTDEHGLATTVRFPVTVLPVNDVPTAGPDVVNTVQDTPHTIALAELLANDVSGPANEATQRLTLSAVAPSSLAGGVVRLDGNRVTYVPPADFHGTDAFTYTVTDDGLTGTVLDPKSTEGTVTVTVRPVTPTNQPPVIRLVRPKPDQLVPLGRALALEGEGYDPDGALSLVEFFQLEAGRTNRLGEARREPYCLVFRRRAGRGIIHVCGSSDRQRGPECLVSAGHVRLP